MLSRFFGPSRRSFDDLSEQEMLALAISSEEDDGRIYLAYADGLREKFPQSAKVFEDMAEEESGHRNRLIALHKKRFGDVIPLIRREHVRGYYRAPPRLAGAPARHRESPRHSGDDGAAGAALLYRSRRPRR